MRALDDKLDRLEQANRPKIVFVGDSNLAFGIESRSIEDRFGMEVHNTGLLRGMGVAFCMNQVRENKMRQDDVFRAKRLQHRNGGIVPGDVS